MVKGLYGRDDAQMVLDTVRALLNSGLLSEGQFGQPHNHPPATAWNFRNASDETIPSYAVVQVSGTVDYERTYFEAVKPQDVGCDEGLFFVNGHEPVESGSFGVVQSGPIVRVLGEAGEAGDRFGAQVDSWEAAPRDDGPFICAGNDKSIRNENPKVMRALQNPAGCTTTTRIKGYLVDCLKKCDTGGMVEVYNPELSPSGTGGKAACNGNGPRRYNLHNGSTAPKELAFNGAAKIQVAAANRWHLDGPAGTAVIIERVANAGATAYEWQITQVEEHIARLVWGTWPSGITGFCDGIDPRDCGDVTVVALDELPCPIDGEFFMARYCPEDDQYVLVATQSAWMGAPSQLDPVWGGDSPGNGISFINGCSLEYQTQPHLGWPCELVGTTKTTSPSLIPVSVLTGVAIDGNDIDFSRSVVYVCQANATTDLTLDGTDCEESSGS